MEKDSVVVDPLLVDSEEEVDSDEESKQKAAQRKAQTFRRKLKAMMYAYGDEKEPLEETVDELDKIITTYIGNVCKKAISLNTSKKLTLNEFFFIIRRDEKKFTRVRELLKMDGVLKKARKEFPADDR